MSGDFPWKNEPSSTGDLAELSGLVADWVAERDWDRYHAPRNLAAALAVEAGELQELFLWRPDDDLLAGKEDQVAAEAADVAICLLNFCNRMGIDLGQAVRDKLVVATKKYPADRVRGRRDKYDEYPEWDGSAE